MKWRNAKGFTLIELMIVVAIIGILAAIAIPIYANVTATARIAKASADVRTLGSAVSIFNAHMGVWPANLAALTAAQTNGAGAVAGPFIGRIPDPPSGWGSAYAYTVNNGMYEISASGDNAQAKAP